MKSMRTVAGRWFIVEMELWDKEVIDLIGPAFIEFAVNGAGRFGFIAVEGSIDARRSDDSRVDFTWVGTDDGDQVSGRGWVENDPNDAGTLRGHIFFHKGDSSGFRAVKQLPSPVLMPKKVRRLRAVQPPSSS